MNGRRIIKKINENEIIVRHDWGNKPTSHTLTCSTTYRIAIG